MSSPNQDEDGIKAARDRAFEILACVEAYLNDAIPQTITTTCRSADLTGGNLSQGLYAGSDFNGRAAQIDFQINVEAQKQP